MKIKELHSKHVEAPLTRGKIHGQGPSKRYSFVIMETDEGIGISELYSGIYNKRLMDACLCEIKNQFLNKTFAEEIWDIKKVLHIPFISGNGMYQACVEAVINCVQLLNKPYELKDTNSLLPYFSGGTVKSSMEDLEFEADHATTNGYHFYKIRLDFRDEPDCVRKIQFLNKLDINYAVDFIANTNFEKQAEEQILKLVNQMNPAKVQWLEEPCAPFNIFEQQKFLAEIRERGFKIAFGESFTSTFEIHAVDRAQLIDVLQLDATINSNISDLIQIARNCWSSLAMHNWGSKYALYINKLVAANSDKKVFFEIPNYETPFDKQLENLLSDETIDITNIPEIFCVTFKKSS